MKVAIASDHGAVELKAAILAHLEKKGIEVRDFGAHTTEKCDFPDYAVPAAKAVAAGVCDKGIVLCTTGIGVSIAANKVKGIRCALLSDEMSARLTREHNDTNMMAMGAGVIGQKLALDIVDTWLGTRFTHEERHQRRIDKIMALENE